MKLELSNVTLFGIDCIDISRLVHVADICQQNISFGAVKLLSSVDYDHPYVIPISKIHSHKEYSDFMLKRMDSYIATEFSLVIQHDGFILNPAAWKDEFLSYDYIGAPYPINNRLVVGNGGFSLRSKRLTSILANDDSILIDNQYYNSGYWLNSIRRYPHENEDQIISEYKRPYLEQQGIRFAPVHIARIFSFEGNHLLGRDWNGQFGFHSFNFTNIPSQII